MKAQFTYLQEALADIKVTTANLVVLIKTTFFGVLAAEVLYFAFLLAARVNTWIFIRGYEREALTLCLVGAILLGFFLYCRGVFTESVKFLKSGRIDIVIATGFGVWLSIAWGGFLSHWSSQFVELLTLPQLFTLMAGPYLLGALVIVRWFLWSPNKNESAFVVDLELQDQKDDLLNFSERANRFAARVYNNGAPDSFVFGVDAPWGVGKSTFVNFCIEYWNKNHSEEVLVYKFNPLKYAGAKNLLELFIDGLISAIQKDSYIPEIRPLISRYSRLLREVGRFSIFGWSFPALTTEYSSEEAQDDLCAVLKRFPKKVVIIVDDLDRLSFAEIKDILFVIRKSFVFPNVSYVICYDTENIGILEANTPDTEKVSEFFEKFVNIKISLYLDKENLAQYVSDSLDQVVRSKFVDPLLVRQAVGGLLDIYKSSVYHNYLPFLGDVRKLKRFINTIVLFELETTDFKNSDFDKRDLANLLLIYIHYPNVFRKIYDTETNGGRGFFSLLLPYDDGYPEEAPGVPRGAFRDSVYKNSTHYTEYIERLPKNSGQRFLLNQVFNVNSRLEDARVDSVPDDIRTSLACFNGGWTNGRNLEAYLHLIVALSKPIDTDQHRFYAARKNKVVEGAATIQDIFSEDQFALDKGENPREKLLRLLVNSARTMKKEVAFPLINYLLDHTPEFSYLEIPELGLGLRHNVDYFLTRLLNDAGWADKQGGHSHNTTENIKEAAEWIFGDGRHVGEGVIEKLSQPERGILGINDLMTFRLFCSADRGGDIFDLTRAIAKHANEKAPTEGDTRDIAREEMREMSQKIFEIFKAQYIDSRRNIFEEIESLGLADFVGSYNAYVESKVNQGVISRESLDKKLSSLKTRTVSFIIYQLGNNEISHGVGCGFYDPAGNEDKGSIRDLINAYLFDVCFTPADGTHAEYFIDYLFRNFASVFASAREDGLQYVPSINEFTKVMDKTKLASYWQTNGPTIKALNLQESQKIVLVGDYEASYKEYIPMIYKVLDDNLAAVTAAAEVVTPPSSAR